MTQQNIYQDIAKRTGGDIYIGVVGPVRSGKSTFITRVMQELVLPNITEVHARERARDELPQSAAGKTVMTTEPKFVPDTAVAVELEGGTSLRFKMIDCVGYMIPEALGDTEQGSARMVHTPWQEEAMPFAQAAEYGTRKVIMEHATIGMLVSSDGTIGEIPRASYEQAEARLIEELKNLGKPFAVILNCADPAAESSRALAHGLEERYGVPIALVNCLSLTAEDIKDILSLVLGEFPIAALRVTLPSWVRALGNSHPIGVSVREQLLRAAQGVRRMEEISQAIELLRENEYISDVRVKALEMGNGVAELQLCFEEKLYLEVLGQTCGRELADEGAVLRHMGELSAIARKYERIEQALMSAEQSGYGIVMPAVQDLRLEKPSIVKQAGGYGVRLRASASSMHFIKADIETEINPIVGTEEQSEDFVRNILAEFESDPQKLWNSNMFGKSLYELVSDGLCRKLEHMPDDARQKLSETLSRIINEGAGGLICILL